MKFSVLGFILIMLSIAACENAVVVCNSASNKTESTQKQYALPIFPGIYRTDEYFDILKNKHVAVVSNQTGMIKNVHLVDTLLSEKINVVKVFCPEHGFRGKADAGQKIDNSIDPATGLNIISLYGKNKKPSAAQLSDVEIIVFDLQDVGVRFYTYISTLHYVMEAAAEKDIPVIILDRPNPNASYVDGPVLDTANCRSFIGMHPVPIIYGMTIGEYGMMINGEGWLKNHIKCKLTVIPCVNYRHDKKYSLPIKPSPNLPNDRSIELYPTLCIFEATTLSLGRGTEKQFQIIGHPCLKNTIENPYTFTPLPNEGASNPVLKGEICYGFDLSENYSIFNWEEDKFNVSLIKKIYELFPEKDNFFKNTNSINLLTGRTDFKRQIIENVSEEDMRKQWNDDIENFKKTRNKYLIYK